MTKPRACLPLRMWPEHDREQWQRAGTDALFEIASVAADWRPTTVETIAEDYGDALRWLDQQGQLRGQHDPAARWTSDVLRSYVSSMTACLSPTTVAKRIISLERALAVISPASDRSALRAAIRNLRAAPVTTRKRARLQDPADLVELGYNLMTAADNRIRPEVRKNASLFRDGLQIALLALRPFRKRNFASLEIGKHVVRVDGAWWLVLSRDETKTRQPVEVPFPQQLVPALVRYLEEYRPLLAGSRYTGSRLWLSYRFTPQAAHSIQLQIVARTQEAFGKSINPHLFRDCVATSIAIHDPENVRMAALILGHRSFATTERYYNLARTLEAGRNYTKVIAQGREKARRSSRKRPK
ncbi:MAG: site-specific integrase [Hyphomicrobiaceae bacterium]